ncbi:MAG: 16S rRNA (adenine(1518)-N(6)/adenine(1519)-N(6))-dimethyltransferase RsmA [Fervidobacterium sp.]
MKKYGVSLKKSLGQNFLSSDVYANKIVELSRICKDDVVLEIGAGAGTLTVALAETGATVFAIEIDKRMQPILSERLNNFDNVKLIFDDFLKTDLSFLLSLPQGFKCVSNIPYYITAPIIKKLLFTNFQSLTLMVQKEVGERLLEPPGSSNRGFLTVVIQTVAKVEKLLTVPKSAFVPNPEVDSLVLKITKKENFSFNSISDLENYWNFVSKAFAQKRKTLLNNLRNMGLTSQQVEVLLDKVGIEKNTRPEQLENEQFFKLWNAWMQL